MRNMLVPIDGTERSMKAVEFVRFMYHPADVKIVLLMVREDVERLYSEKELEKAKAPLVSTLDAVAERLIGYDVRKEVVLGHAGEAILTFAAQNGIDVIVMTKSTKPGWFQRIGSVAEHVVKYAKCIVVIVPEDNSKEKSVRKIQCDYLDDIVTLSGQLNVGHSTCLLPVQVGACVYKIVVISGNLRMNHLSYNPDGGSWLLPPQNNQPSHYDLCEGEEREIRLEVTINYGNMDHIEIVNSHMTKPLKFHYVARFDSLDV